MSQRTSPSFLRYLAIILIGLGVVLAIIDFVSSRDVSPDPAKSPNVAQEQTHSFVPQLCFLSASQLARIPIIDGIQYPCGSPRGALIYDAQTCGAMNPKRGGSHTGHDLNGIGGGASDMGMSIYAVARGLVVYSGTPSADWGQVLILAHRLPDGRLIQSLYAHLEERLCERGTYVQRGELIGRMGSAGGLYVPHLHVELVESMRIPVAQAAYLPSPSKTHFNLDDMVRAYPAPLFPDCYTLVRRQGARSSIQLIPHLP